MGALTTRQCPRICAAINDVGNSHQATDFNESSLRPITTTAMVALPLSPHFFSPLSFLSSFTSVWTTRPELADSKLIHQEIEGLLLHPKAAS